MTVRRAQRSQPRTSCQKVWAGDCKGKALEQESRTDFPTHEIIEKTQCF